MVEKEKEIRKLTFYTLHAYKYCGMINHHNHSTAKVNLEYWTTSTWKTRTVYDKFNL